MTPRLSLIPPDPRWLSHMAVTLQAVRWEEVREAERLAAEQEARRLRELPWLSSLTDLDFEIVRHRVRAMEENTHVAP